MSSATEGPPRADWLRPTIEALQAPRSPGVASDFPPDGRARVRLLHLNESACPASPKAIAAAQAAAGELHRYPDPMATALTAELAERTGLPSGRIVVGAGSDDLIRVLVDIACDPGDEIVAPAPSFPLFAAAARLRDAVPVRVALTADGANDVDGALAAVAPRTRLVFCCTPNPPNGAPTSAAAVERLARQLPDTVMLVLDAAYQEFAVHAGEPDLLPVLQQRSGPWVILRTFSKAYALAGLRAGYALCGSERIAEALRTSRLGYTPNTIAQAAALAALRDREHLARSLDTIAHERRRLSEGLRGLGLSPYPSVTNFVSVELPMPAADSIGALRSRNILVRGWRDPDHEREIRITVGCSDDTDAVLAALHEILRKNTAIWQ